MSEPAHITALRERLAVCEAETEAWEKVYKQAEDEMSAKLAGYRAHHTEIQKLKRALSVLVPTPTPELQPFDGSGGA